MNVQGKVNIVGAGPGPSDLLTIRALRAIEEADVILYDALISHEVKKLFPQKAEKVFVGKRAGDGCDVTVRQNTIHQKMYLHAKEGRIVTRVKSGDPMIFSRGAEETGFLKEKQIPFEVVPGISAVNAAASEFGVALTDRRGSNSLHLLSGRDVSGSTLNGHHLVNILENRGTAVIYMGTKVLEEIQAAFDQNFRENINAVIISRSGRSDAAKLEGKLDDVVARHRITPLKTPALIFLKNENYNAVESQAVFEGFLENVDRDHGESN